MQYAYTEGASGNNSRLTSMTYPNGKVLNYNYGTGVDSTISRLSSLSDTSGTLESYSYLGLGTVVKRAHPQPNVDLTYITAGGSGDGGDQYTGLDRFGRVVEQKWYNNGTSSTTDDFKYGYDRNSNVLWRTNEINHSFDELYHANGSTNGYDNLNQLTAFARGTLNANHDTISSPSHSINYTLDAEGNFANTQTDGGSSVSNSFNKQNEETAAGTANLTFDANGNLTTDDLGHTLIYDAWNRLVTVKNGTNTLTSYQYDALGRRVVENPGTVHDLYYDAAWQLLEERWGGVSTATIQYVWSPVYIDAMVLRDRSTQNNGTLDERLWVQQDANWNVTALYNGSGSVVERYVYDPYGKQTVLDANFNTRTGSSYGFVHGFQGLRLDATSGLYHARNRDLSPTLGRWIQPDPEEFGAGDTNFYRGESDEPLGITDPTGLQPPPIQRRMEEQNREYNAKRALLEAERRKLADEYDKHPKWPDDRWGRNLQEWWERADEHDKRIIRAFHQPPLPNPYRDPPQLIRGKIVPIFSDSRLGRSLKEQWEKGDECERRKILRMSPWGITGIMVVGAVTTVVQPNPSGVIIVTPGGDAIRIPPGYSASAAQNGKGIVYRPSGSSSNAGSIRIMEPTAQYPNGYGRIYNNQGQPINPATGKPGSQAQTHIPFNPSSRGGTTR